MSKHTHTRDLARALSEDTDLTYQQAHQLVVDAREAGHLPERLDDAGMQKALELLKASLSSADAFDRLPTGRLTNRPPRERGKIIAVVSPKGGTGDSPLALNLASHLGRTLQPTGQQVCLVDAKLQQADAGKYLGSYKPNVVGLSGETGVLDAATVSRYLHNNPSAGISALLGPATPLKRVPRQVNSELYRRVAETLREIHAVTFVDAPVAGLFNDMFDDFILEEADFIIVAVAPNMTSLLNADMWLRAITAAPDTGGGYPVENLGIVLDCNNGSVNCTEAEVRKDLSQWRFLGAIPESNVWAQAADNHELVAIGDDVHLDTAFADVIRQVIGTPVEQQT